jgi:heat-inducible transcriptional repressor
MSNPGVADRQRRILARLVTEYIEQGEPVSSAWLAEHSALGLSSATVRTILASLEEQGLVHQPHTSAGRVPTDSGYRLYVDGLLGTRKRSKALPGLAARLRRAGTVGDALEGASQELSRASHHIGFALAPASPTVRLRHIDFVRLDTTRVLVVLVATGGQITHRVVDIDSPCDDMLLTQAANYVNAEFAGLTLHEARTAVEARMRQERWLYDALMARALRLARAGLDETTPAETLHVQGTSYLVDELLGDSADRDRTLEALRALFRMIEEKHQLVELLTRYIESSGLTIVIGSEHTSPDLHPLSLVVSTFNNGHRSGTIGVIGPTRMRYERAIAVVDSVSRTLTDALNVDGTPE